MDQGPGHSYAVLPLLFQRPKDSIPLLHGYSKVEWVPSSPRQHMLWEKQGHYPQDLPIASEGPGWILVDLLRMIR